MYSVQQVVLAQWQPAFSLICKMEGHKDLCCLWSSNHPASAPRTEKLFQIDVKSPMQLLGDT